jgi:very-short-patch-repair endonuclease
MVKGITYDAVYQKYFVEELSLDDCTKYFDVRGSVFRKKFNEFGFKPRPNLGKTKGRINKLKNSSNIGSKTKEYFARIKGNLPENEIIRRQKIKKAMTGREHTWGDKISKSMLGNQNCKGRVLSEEEKARISETNKKTIRKKILEGRYRPNFGNIGMLGKHHSPETKRKLRKSTIKYIEKMKLNGMPLTPRIGKTEQQILDALEKEFGYKIERQFRIAGYFLDGYIPELRIAIEVDEPGHDEEKDQTRQKEIENLLNCDFLRFPA